MGKYKLIALDMDGTLLNSKKQITGGTKKMIRRAAEEGKIVALSTGRGLAELHEYLEQVPEVRYLDCTSGAVVYDCQEKKVIARRTISVSDMEKLMEIASQEDVMVHFLSERSIVQKDKVEKMEEYHMGIYKTMFETKADHYEDIFKFYSDNPVPMEKCNIYHHTPEERTVTEEKIKAAGLPVVMVHAEETSLEITAEGVNKAAGLLALCRHLDISPEETIVVGDADNDREVLQTAGLAIAMGNAADHIKALADVVVADCDHDGCAEAIEKYLL